MSNNINKDNNNERVADKTVSSNANSNANPNVNDNASNSDHIDMADEIFKNGKDIDVQGISKLKDPKLAPSATIKQINGAYKDIDVNTLTEEEQTAVLLQEGSENFIEYDDVGYRKNMDNLTNEVQGSKPLRSKPLVINKKVTKAKAALLKLKQASGLGSHVNIALWHSGFYVTIEPMTDEEIIKLELELTNELFRVGKQTHTLIYSNYSILFAEVILKYFKSKIIASSLALEEDQDILDYIHINDINTIATNMAVSMYPNGFNAIIPCTNSAVIENGKPKCTNTKNVKLDLSLLQWEDLTKLTPKHIQQMNKTNPNTVKIEEVIEYQKTLPNSGEVVESFKLPYPTGDEVDIRVHIQAPNVSYYLEAGRDFITSLREAANKIVQESKQLKKPEEAEEILLRTYYLQLYIHYIRSIKIEEATLTTIPEIKEGLNTLVSNEDIREKLLNAIKDYIDNSFVSIVGIPNYICERCKQPQSKHELIPIAPFEYFFVLLHSKYERMIERYQKRNKKEKER